MSGLQMNPDFGGLIFRSSKVLTRMSSRSSFRCCKCSPRVLAIPLKLSFRSTGLLQNPGSRALVKKIKINLKNWLSEVNMDLTDTC